MKRHIGIKDCVDRGLYRLTGKRLNVGVFRAIDACFVGLARRFGYQEFDLERHSDLAGTATPLELLGICPLEGLGAPNEALRHWLMEQGEAASEVRVGRRRKKHLKGDRRKV